jgi:hypothetical protein
VVEVGEGVVFRIARGPQVILAKNFLQEVEVTAMFEHFLGDFATWLWKVEEGDCTEDLKDEPQEGQLRKTQSILLRGSCEQFFDVLFRHPCVFWELN